MPVKNPNETKSPEGRKRILEKHLTARGVLERLRVRQRELSDEMRDVTNEITALEFFVDMTKEVVCASCNGHLLVSDVSPTDPKSGHGLRSCPNCQDGTRPIPAKELSS